VSLLAVATPVLGAIAALVLLAVAVRTLVWAGRRRGPAT
jgi:hypothetical protein